jgi:hypothetical protein
VGGCFQIPSTTGYLSALLKYHQRERLCENLTSHSPQASAWDYRCPSEAVNVFNGYLERQILRIDAISETVKTVAEIRLGRANPKLKLGENEKLSFHSVTAGGGICTFVQSRTRHFLKSVLLFGISKLSFRTLFPTQGVVSFFFC